MVTLLLIDSFAYTFWFAWISRKGVPVSFLSFFHSTTDSNGRCGDLLQDKQENATPGRFKIEFRVDDYFKRIATISMFPMIDVMFDVQQSSEHYHIPLLLNPFGFTTYRGSWSASRLRWFRHICAAMYVTKRPKGFARKNALYLYSTRQSNCRRGNRWWSKLRYWRRSIKPCTNKRETRTIVKNLSY